MAYIMHTRSYNILLLNKSTIKKIMHTYASRTDVAQRAGVSEATVSRSLSDSPLIPAHTKEKVRAIARELGYVPSKQAASFACKRTFRLGLVSRTYKTIPPFSRPYLPAILDGAVQEAEARNYLVTIILDQKNNELKDLVEIVRSREVDGLLLTVVSVGDFRLETLKRSKIPFVLINSYGAGCNSVDVKPDEGIRQVIDHCLQNSHRRIGFITGDLKFQNALDRQSVFVRIAKERTIEYQIAEGNFSRDSGYACAGRLLQSATAPTAIFCSSDREALGVMEYCKDHSIKIPDDVSLIGYDNFDVATIMNPALTTIDNFARQTGRDAASLLMDVIENKVKKPTAHWLKSKLIVRQSTGSCKKQQPKKDFS